MATNKKYFVIESKSEGCLGGCDEYTCCAEDEDNTPEVSLKEVTLKEMLQDKEFVDELKLQGFYTKEEVEQKYPNISHVNKFYYSTRGPAYDDKGFCVDPLKDLNTVPQNIYRIEDVRIFQEVFLDSVKETKLAESIQKKKNKKIAAEKRRRAKEAERKKAREEKRKQKELEKAKKVLEGQGLKVIKENEV